MLQRKIYACSIQEVVALENGIRQRVLDKCVEETYIVFYKWFPYEIVKYICTLNYPMAVVAYRVKGTQNSYDIEFVNRSKLS